MAEDSFKSLLYFQHKWFQVLFEKSWDGSIIFYSYSYHKCWDNPTQKTA